MAVRLSRKFVRYIVTGGLSFIFEYSIFAGVVYVLGFSPEIGQVVSYILALVVNFLLLRMWAFKSEDGSGVRRHIIKYGFLVAFNLPATALLIGWLVSFGLVPLLAKVVVVVLTAVWNYAIYDKLIFKQPLSVEDVV